MTLYEKLSLYYRFGEGGELENAVLGLVSSAQCLCGIGREEEATVIVMVLKKLVGDHICYLIDSKESWDEYYEIDEELYSLALNGMKKLTKKEFFKK
jgi:hypothetical protein